MLCNGTAVTSIGMHCTYLATWSPKLLLFCARRKFSHYDDSIDRTKSYQSPQLPFWIWIF